MLFTEAKKSKGVSILFVVLIMSVILSIGFGISGILIQQVKITEEIGNAVVSFYAADTGVEQQLFDLYKLPDHQSGYAGNMRAMNNTVSYNVAVKCSPSADCFLGPENIDDNCAASNFCVKSIGSFQKTKRAIEIKY